ncbi:MAG: Dipeptidyl anminopeptidase [Labilithrix sp.]|nr:Dipeptidyl anminopeptidase [Labilithrix sp.]
MRRVVASLVVGSLVLASACGGGDEAKTPKQSVLGVIATTDAGTSAKAAPPRADETLLPRAVLFSNPDHAFPQISPDGKRIAWLAAVDGVLNVWVSPAADLAKGKPVTQDKKRGIRVYRWAFDNEHLIYQQDKDGDENWHLHAVDVKSATDRDLTPIEGAHAQIEERSHKVPGEILVGINDRDKRFHDVYRVNLATGAKKLVQKNDGFASFSFDDDYKLRLAIRPEKDGSSTMLEPDGKDGFKELSKIPMADTLTTSVVGFDKTGQKAYLVDSRDRDTAAVVELDLATKKSKVILDDGQADVQDILLHPTERKVQAAYASYDRLRWHALDDKVRADFETIKQAAPGDMRILSRTQDDQKWVVSTTQSDGPVKFWIFDRPKKKLDFLFSNVTALEDKPLAKMNPVMIKSRDGLELVSYLTLPKAVDGDGDGKMDAGKGPVPMVLLVHGGPWARDEYRLDSRHQWLASRGYAVLSVNYRGSTGFGKKFINAGDKQWSAKMHDDLLDAVDWAVAQKIAPKDKVAIMGGSYGGYATLVGLTFTPETFACGVDIVGPSNVVTLLQSIPPYWESEIEQFTRRIGDYRTEDGKKFLASISPISRADKIKRPLLIGQGKNDPRVKQAESDQIVHAMQAKNIPVTYVLYPDEGHGFARPENGKSFNAIAEIFLAQCLGGPYQPIGQDFQGSSVTVPVGKENVTSLDAALPR